MFGVLSSFIVFFSFAETSGKEMQGQKLITNISLKELSSRKNDSATQRKSGMFYMSKIPEKTQ